MANTRNNICGVIMRRELKKFCPYCGHKQVPTSTENNMLEKFRQHKIHLNCEKCSSVMVIRKYVNTGEVN